MPARSTLFEIERSCSQYRVAMGDRGLLIYMRPPCAPHRDPNLLEFDVFESAAVKAAEQNATLHKNVCV